MPHGWNYRRSLDGERARYDTIVEIGVDPLTGKRPRIKRTYLTKRQANEGLAMLLAEARSGALVPHRSTTMAALMDLWLEQSARPRVSESTHLGYVQTVRRHIVPYLGGVAVQRITPAHLHALFTALRDRGVGARTVQLTHLHISQALDYARRLGWVGRNVAADVERPRWRAKEMSVWTLDEVQRFLAVADQSVYGPLWHVALGTGVRRGEVLGLRWCDLDIDSGLLSVRQTLGVVQGQIVVKPPKTAASRRTIHLPPTLRTVLLTHQQQRESKAGGTPLAPNGLSSPAVVGRRSTPTIWGATSRA